MDGVLLFVAAISGGANDLVAERVPPAELRLRILTPDQRGADSDRPDPSDAPPLGTPDRGDLSKLEKEPHRPLPQFATDYQDYHHRAEILNARSEQR